MFGAADAVSRLQIRICSKYDNSALLLMFKRYPLQGFINSNIVPLPKVTRNFSSFRRSGLPSKSWRTYIAGWNQNSQQTLLTSNLLKRFASTNFSKPRIMRATQISNNPLKINTNVNNNVMLYRFEKDVLMRGALLFGIVATFACLFMADNVYLILCKDLFNETIPLKERLQGHIFPIVAITIGVLAGPAIIAGIWFLTIRTIKYIVLHKGGENVTIVTYHPLKKFKKMTLPVTHVNCTTAREDIKAYVMLKIKNKKYQFFVDKGGHFVNPELFDCTVGVSRDF